MKNMISVTGIFLSLTLAGNVSADIRWENQIDHSEFYEDSARVIKVKPIYETVDVSVPEQRCWNEKVRRHTSRHDDPYTRPLLGAIIGGVVGNQFGHKSGKTAMTVAGSLLGASIGNSLTHNHHPRHARGYRNDRHCETVENIESREEIVAYRVKYRYKGRVYHTRMDRHPGDSLRIQVNIRPLEY